MFIHFFPALHTASPSTESLVPLNGQKMKLSPHEFELENTSPRGVTGHKRARWPMTGTVASWSIVFVACPRVRGYSKASTRSVDNLPHALSIQGLAQEPAQTA